MNNKNMQDQYINQLQQVLTHGTVVDNDRTGIGTTKVFGQTMKYSANPEKFPILTTKSIHFKSIVVELLWMLNGDDNIKYLNDHGVRIWNEWSTTVTEYPSSDRICGWVRNKTNIGHSYSGDFSSGNLEAARGSNDDKLINIWVHIMKRCYDTTNKNYAFYGGNGVLVHKDWHICANFMSDAKTLVNWDKKNANWNDFDLDKDYFKSNVYSKDTCVWLDSKENNLYNYTSIPLEITIDGITTTFLSIGEASTKLKIPRTTLHRWKTFGFPKSPNKENIKFKDIKFKELFKDGHSYRYLFTDGSLNGVYGKQWRSWPRESYEVGELGKCWINSIDQVENLIDTIKTNPQDRRQMVTAWNVGKLDEMNLPPCHHTWQTMVTGNKLNLSFTMRSNDLFLGKPFNLTQYALLLNILARLTGYEVGEVMYTGVDCHVYSNHIEQSNEIIERWKHGTIPSEPKLVFSDDIDFTSLESFLITTLDNPERIYLDGYVNMGKISATVAV